MSRSNIFKSILTISALSVVSKLIGFFKEGVIAAYIGTSVDADIFFLAYGFFFMVSFSIGIALGTAFLPEYVRCKSIYGEKKSMYMFSGLLNQVFVLMIAFSVLLWISMPFLTDVMFSSYSIEGQQLISNYLRLMILSLPFAVVQYVFFSVLEGDKRFGVKEVVSMAYSVFTILFVLLWYEDIGVLSLVYAVIASSVFKIVVLYFFVYSKRCDYSFSLSNEMLEITYKNTLPILLKQGSIKLTQYADKIIASTLVVGAVSAISYSAVLHSIVNALFILSISSVFYSHFADNIAQNDYGQLAKNFRTGIVSLILIIAPISIIMFINSEDIVSLLLQRGAFDSNSVRLTALALSFYVLGSPFYGIIDLVSRFYYSIGDTKTPMYVEFTSGGITILLAFLLSKIYGVAGITVATSFVAMLTSAFYFYMLPKKKIDLGLKMMLPSVFKIIISLIVTFFCVFAIKQFLVEWRAIARLIICSMCLVVSYFGSLYLIRSEELMGVFNLIANKIFKR